MRNIFGIFLFICFLLSLGTLSFGQGSPSGRALSLRVLQNRLQDCQKRGPCPDELLQMAGIRKIKGYLIDEKTRDLILLGQADENRPPLYLEDWVIALRNAWLKYAELKGDTYFYSDPACSIDPDPRVIQQLQQSAKSILGQSDLKDIERGIQDWNRICRSPQRVRVLGIPFDTRFARVMVRADYDMKKLVDGSDSLEAPGFKSLTDLTLDLAKRDLLQGNPTSLPPSTMNRFWFCPGENQYREDSGVVTIEHCPVVLLTEQEYLTRSGEITGRGKAEPLAQKFTESFSARYAQISKQRPIYAELENLFLFVALAKIMKFKSPQEEARLSLAPLLEDFPIHPTPVESQLPGHSQVKEFRHREDFAGGHRTFQLWLPSCGGVGINIQVGPNNFSRDGTDRAASLKAGVLKARPAPEALSWFFPFP